MLPVEKKVAETCSNHLTSGARPLNKAGDLIFLPRITVQVLLNMFCVANQTFEAELEF